MRGGKSKIMPKVFQINVTANWGSTGKIAEQIGSCAIQHGWDSYLAYGRMSNPSKNSLIKIGNQLYVYEHYIENKLFDNEGLASRYATVKLINKIKEMSSPELEKELNELKSELFKLRFSLATNGLENPMKIKEVKKDIAKINTILKERELEENK